MVEANVILILAADRGDIAEGDFVDALLFEGFLRERGAKGVTPDSWRSLQRPSPQPK